MADILKGISEIMDKKDPATGSSGGLLTGITKGVNEALDSVLGGIPTFGAPGRNYAFLGNPEKDGGGIHEYQMSRDMAQAVGTGFLENADFTSPTPGPYGVIKGGITGALGAAAAGAAARRTWDTDIRENTARLNAVLEERSYIDFYFPNLSIGRGGVRRVAFFENPSIRENRLARYATQNIVARNEPARLYVGSDARKLTLDFTFTLPHVEYFFKMCYQESLKGWNAAGSFTEGATVARQFEGRAPRAYWQDWKAYTDYQLQKFFGFQFDAGPAGTPGVGKTGPEQVSAEETKGTVFIKNVGPDGPRFYEPTFQEPKNGFQLKGSKEQTYNEFRHMQQVGIDPTLLGEKSAGMMATYYTQFVIDTIRASVVGDDVNAARVGPPIVRFRHGTVFNEAPFIVKNFNITYPTDKGYEYRTLVPRQVKFSLSLEEFRQTHGSHHGDNSNEQVPDASDILDLTLPFQEERPYERQRYPR